MKKEFIIIPDTNILYSKKPEEIVGSRFTSLYEECLKLTKLKIVVPELVKDELCIQQYRIAKKAKDNIAKSQKTLDSITNTSSGKQKTDNTIMSNIRGCFNSFIKKYGAKVEKTPYEGIDVKSLVKKAIANEPPFESFSEGESSDKGFKDAVILETVLKLCEKHSNKDIVFLTSDKRLQEGFKLRKEKSEKHRVFGELSEFKSNLEILAKEEADNYINTVLTSAPLVFFNKEKQIGFVYDSNVISSINDKFKYELNYVYEKDPFSVQPGIIDTMLSSNNRTAFAGSAEKIFVNETKLFKMTSNGAIWKTRITYARLLIWKSIGDQSDPSLHNSKIRLVEFSCNWDSTLNTAGLVSPVSIIEVNLDDKKFIVPTEENKLGFDLL